MPQGIGRVTGPHACDGAINRYHEHPRVRWPGIDGGRDRLNDGGSKLGYEQVRLEMRDRCRWIDRRVSFQIRHGPHGVLLRIERSQRAEQVSPLTWVSAVSNEHLKSWALRRR